MNAVDITNPDEIRREAARRQRLREQGAATFDESHNNGIVMAQESDSADARREKDVEHAGDKLMLAHGFMVIRLSQPRASKITPGVPDRRYYRPPRIDERPDGRFIDAVHGHTCWWEAKAIDGKQSPAQRHFQELVESCGEIYLLGTDAVLRNYLQREGLLR